MKPLTRGIAALVAMCAAVLAGPATAVAVDVGPGTGGTPAFEAGCEVALAAPPSCSLFDGLTSQTPRGQWRVRSVSVRTGSRTGPIRFTMIRALRSQAGTQGIICCHASGQSRIFTPAPNRVTTIPVDMAAVNTVEVIDGERVEVVDYLGISLLNPSSAIAFRAAEVPGTAYFSPAFTTGATRLPGAIAYQVVPMIRADLRPCPTARSGSQASASRSCPGVRRGFSVAKRVRLSRGGTRARLTVRVPRAGRLVVAGQAAARRFVQPARRKVRRGTARVFATLNARGRRVLRRNGRLTVRIRVTLRPNRGKAVSRQIKVRFRR